MPERTRPKILVITLGEATLDLAVPWAQAGVLPTFKRLMETGAWGPIKSQIPLITPQMWGSIITGTNPGQHGAFDFWQRGPDGRFREINGSGLKQPAIWRLLSDGGLSCGIVNLPFTYPPQRINGFMIAGQDAPGAHRSVASPPAVYDELVKRFGRYRLKDIFPGGRRKEDYLTLIEEDIRKQTDVLEYLIATKPWDFFMTFYSATAMAQHYFWADMEPDDSSNPFRDVLPGTYRYLDAALDRLMKAAGPDTLVFIISECGAGRLQSGVQINAWLSREGFLAWKTPPATASDAAVSSHSRSGLGSVLSDMQKRAKRGLPPSLYFLANRYLGPVKNWIRAYQNQSSIAWEKTQAFSQGKEGDIFINMKGRDPHGIVQPGAEYDVVCSRIIERLQCLVNPESGEPAVERIFRAKELYEGPWLPWAPDLIVDWRNHAYMPTEEDGDRVSVFVPRMREHMDWATTGSHRIDGMLFAAGPGIAPGTQLHGARIIDLMPTWLAALGQPVPADVRGRPIAGLVPSS